MRYRATLLMLMALLLGIAPYLQWHKEQAACILTHGAPDDRFAGLLDFSPESQSVCPDVSQPAPWVHALGILCAACFAGSIFFYFQGIAARRHEQALLRGAGVNVPEDELPLEE
jgi:hypothetical protein